MKVSLIVVQGKPEGKVIPLAMPRFRIGRGEGCHLRPNNEQISRNHAEVEVGEDRVVVRDLGSRNGTFVNNQRVPADQDHVLRNKDLIQVGPLTFAVSIQGAPAPAAAPTAPTDKAERALAKAAALDELSNEEIDAWLVGDKDNPAPERPSGVYKGDTMTFAAYKTDSEAQSQPSSEPAEPVAKVEPEEAEEPEDEDVAEAEDETPEPPPADDIVFDKLDDEDGGGAEIPEELIDESNPFYAAKKTTEEPVEAEAKKQRHDVDSSKAAEDILRKMMDRRRATR